MIVVIATIHIRPEKRADFLENARTVIAQTVKEQGCRSYDLMSSITEPNAFTFVERWETRDALSAHFETAHLKEWRRVCEDFVVDRTVEIVHPERIEVL